MISLFTLACMVFLLVCQIGVCDGDVVFSSLLSISVCSLPSGVIPLASGDVIVTCAGGGVVRMNGRQLSVVLSKLDCPHPINAAVHPMNGLLYTTCRDRGLVAVNLNNLSLKWIAKCSNANGLLIHTNGTIYTSCKNQGPYGRVISADPFSDVLRIVLETDDCVSPGFILLHPTNPDIIIVLCRANETIITFNGGQLTNILTPEECAAPTSHFIDVPSQIFYVGCDGQPSGSSYTMTVNLTNGAISPFTVIDETVCGHAAITSLPNSGDIYLASCQSSETSVVAFQRQQLYSVASSSQCPTLTEDRRGLVVDPFSGLMYLMCPSLGVLTVSGAPVQSVFTLQNNCRPSSIFFSASNGMLYFDCLVSDAIYAIPWRSAFSSPSSLAASAGASAQGVAFGVIDVLSRSATLLATCKGASGMTFDSSTSSLLVSCSGNTDTSDGNRIIGVNSTGGIESLLSCTGPQSVVLTPMGIYAACTANNSVVHLLSSHQTNEIQCLGATSLAYDSKHSVVYAACQNQVVAINMTDDDNTMQIINQQQCRTPFALVFRSSDDMLFVACRDQPNSIIAFNVAATATAPQRIIATTSQCDHPAALGLNDVSGQIVAACGGIGVLAIDVDSNISFNATGRIRLLASTTQCPNPVAVTVDDLEGTIFAACSTSDSSGGFISIPFFISACPPGFILFSSSCVPCAKGTFQPYAPLVNASFLPQSSAECIACPKGLVAVNDGSTECLPCANGNVYIGGVACSPCKAGKYAVGIASDCSLCGAGNFSDHDGASSCYLCKPGSFSVSGSSQCISCSAGSFAANWSSSVCQLCSVNQFTSVNGSAACARCNVTAGFSTFGASGASACSTCAAGSYLLPFNVSIGVDDQCKPCDAGTASSSPVVSACPLCSAGRFSDSGATQCTDCPAGTFASQRGASVCLVCSAGYYQNRSAQTKCQPCEPGYFRQNSSSSINATACSACVPGSFSANLASNTCTMCGAGRYSDSWGATFCVSCADGMTSPAGAVECSSAQSDSSDPWINKNLDIVLTVGLGSVVVGVLVFFARRELRKRRSRAVPAAGVVEIDDSEPFTELNPIDSGTTELTESLLEEEENAAKSRRGMHEKKNDNFVSPFRFAFISGPSPSLATTANAAAAPNSLSNDSNIQ